MSENTNNGNFSSPMSRKIGVGLTRTNLSQGKCDVTRQPVRNAPLLTPNRIIISGPSLATSRPGSDRYVSAYKRLGGLKHASEPNVSKTSHLQSEVVTLKKDTDFNHNSDLPLRKKNFSAINTSLLLKNENVSGVNVQGSVSGVNATRVEDYTTKASDDSRSAVSDTGNGTFRRWNDNCQKSVNSPDKEGNSECNLECTKVENYDLDLEQDEEDAVKVAGDGSKTTYIGISPNSPSKDSGYHSPRIDSCNIEVGTVSQETSELLMNRLIPDRDNLMVVPERPARSKHSTKKQSFDYLEQRPQPPNRQKAKTSDPDSCVTTTKNLGQENENNIQSDVLRCSKKDLNQNEATNQVTRSLCEGGSEVIPVAKPRTHRRLTQRSISFKRLEEDEYIGFASLPEQVHRKAVRRGFEFTLMVVGETGLGKSTLINSLFLMDLYKDRKVGNIEERVQKTVELEKKELEIEERGVKLKLTIVDTPGFNDAVNAEESWKPIVNYIDKQFDGYFKAESGLNRKNIQDTRVHCCLYFISPYGHGYLIHEEANEADKYSYQRIGLRPVDVMVMKKLHHKVNIIPLIAKADMLTKLEAKRLKERVLHEIQKHNIHIYQYPDCDSDEDEEFKLQDKELKKSIPFAVVGSNTVVEAGGKKIRGRMYPWGIVEVENPLHSDFMKLRQMLISTHMQDLKDVTCDVHYENFRAEHISEQMTTAQRERGKLKRDSAANLDSALVTEKLLQEKDAEIKRMQEMLAQMQAQLHSNSPKPNGRIGQL